MKAIVLAAGIGSRLYPFTTSIAKPMMPIANRPVMEHILRNLQGCGFDEIFSNVFYRPDEIMTYFGNGADWKVSLQWKQQPALTGPAGGAAIFADLLEPEETLVVVSADALHDIDLRDLVDFHLRHQALLSVVMKQVHHPQRYGVGRLDEQQRIIAFAEKPELSHQEMGLVSCGIYCLNASLLRLVPPGRVYDFGADLIPELAAQKKAVFGFETHAYWRDIGSLSEFYQANLDAICGNVRLILPGACPNDGVYVEEGASLAPDVILVPPILIGASTVIHAGTRIVGPAVLGASVIVGEHSYIERSVILDGAHVPPYSALVEGLIGVLHPTKGEEKYHGASIE